MAKFVNPNRLKLYRNDAIHNILAPELELSLGIDRQHERDGRVNQYYLFGGRNAGKTFYLLWLMWFYYEKYQKDNKQINFIWIRNQARDMNETFKTIKASVPNDEYVTSFSAKNMNLQLKHGAIICRNFNLGKESFRSEQFQLGDFYPASDYNFIFLDEAYQLAQHNKNIINSILLLAGKTCRTQQLAFFTFNAWTLLNSLVRECDKKVPFDDETFITKGPFYKWHKDRGNKEGNSFYLRLNYLALKNKAGHLNRNLISKTAERSLLFNKGTVKERVVVYGDNGIEEKTYFSSYLPKIVWLKESDIFESFRTLGDFRLHGKWVAGLDLAHTRDRTSFIIGRYERHLKKLVLVEHLFFLLDEMPADKQTTEAQVESILKFLQAKMKKWDIDNITIVCDTLQALDYSLDKKIDMWHLDNKVKIVYIKEKTRSSELDVLHRLTRMRVQMDSRNLFINAEGFDTKKNFFWLHQELQHIKVDIAYGRHKIITLYSDAYDALCNILIFSNVNRYN